MIYMRDWGSRGKDATNQPKELSVLRVFQDLRLFFHDSVAEDSCPIPAPICQMSRLHAPTLPPDFSVRCREPRKK